MRSWQLGLVILVLAGCAEDSPSGGSGQNSTAGTSAAGASAGTGQGESGISGGGEVAGSSGGAGTTGTDLGDGGMCEVGKFCVPGGPDPDNCGTLTLEGDVKTIEMPGNVIMIFDRSGSMTSDWNGMQRWQAAGGAMMSALMPVQDQLTIGAIFFPSDQGLLSCVVDPIATATQIQFDKGPAALMRMQTGGAGGIPMYQPGLGSTPTLDGLKAADAALTGATLTGETVAILVTDGDPTCTWNQAEATTLVSAWAAKGIKTYVLGVPGVGGNGVTTLNAVAMAGGTMQYIAASDAMMLQKKILDIVLSTVTVGIDSCTINFDPAAMTPDKLTLAVKQMGVEQAVPHEYPSGEKAWTITPDGKTVELLGNTCDAAKSGAYESLRFVFGCEDLPPADPPNPE